MEAEDKLTGQLAKAGSQVKRFQTIAAKTQTPLAKWKGLQKGLTQDLKTTQKQLETARMDKQIGKVGRALNKSSQAAVVFNGNLLSILFFGMEMQRIFTGALKAIFEGYKSIIPETHKFNIMTTKLSANWEFFKFQLADAFANSKLFQVMIGGAIKLLKVFQALPKWAKFLLVVVTIILAMVGALMLYIGIIGLGVAALINLKIAMGVTGSLTVATFAKMGVAAKAFWASAYGPATLLVVVIGIVLASIGKLFSKFFLDEGKEIKGFWRNMLAGGFILLAGIGNILTLIVTGFFGIFTMIYDGFKFLFKSIGTLGSSFGKALAAAIKAGIVGGLGAAKEAFSANFNAADLGDQLGDNFSDAFGNGATMKLGQISNQVSSSINQWNRDMLDKLATPTDTTTANLDGFDSTLAQAAQIPAQSTQTQNIVVNVEGNEVGVTEEVMRIKEEVNSLLAQLGAIEQGSINNTGGVN